MGREISWFRMESAKARKRQERDYQRRMFPLGEAQRDGEVALLRGLLETRMPDNDMLYQLLCVKDCLQLPDEEDRQEDLSDWMVSPLAKRMTKQDRAVLVALVLLEEACTAMEDFPEPERVLAGAQELLAAGKLQ